MKRKYIIICIFCSIGCTNINERKNVGAFAYIMSTPYKYSTSKSSIPTIVMDSLSKIDHALFKIGDSTDTGKVNLSDSKTKNDRYTQKLHFVLLSDSSCLIAYTKGGLGSYDVIDYVRYKGRFKHLRYKTLKYLTDTVELLNYLKFNHVGVTR